MTAPVTMTLGNVTGTVKNNSGVGPRMVKVSITVAGAAKTAYTSTAGTYTINSVKPGPGAQMTATKGLTTYAT